MYIQPNTNIKLLKGVPLDISYDHTLYFESTSAQSSYFSSKTKYNLSNYTYQRVNNETMKVGLCADNIYDCNYLMFQNTSFGSKWFYAFITKVNYINNDVAEIEYELDDMQTWYFDYEYEDCFIERQHTETDELFEHIAPEPVETGEYVYLRRNKIDEAEMCVYVMVNKVDYDFDGDGHLYFKNDDSAFLVQAYWIDDTLCASKIYAFRNTDTGLASLRRLIDNLMNSRNHLDPDRLINAYMGLVSNDLNFNAMDFCEVQTGARGQHHVITGDWSTNSLKFPSYLPTLGKPNASGYGGYTPKNKKLYTYPYFFPMVYNGTGQALELRYEFGRDNTSHYDGGRIDILILSNILPPIQSIAMPTNYKCLSEWHDGEPSEYPMACLNEQISISNYPTCSFSGDAYKVWTNRNLLPSIINATGNVFSSVSGYKDMTSRGAIASGASSLVSNISSYLANGYQASLVGSITKGNANCCTPLTPNKMLTYFSCVCSVTVEYAKRIDDFFTMFGYSLGICAKPNQKARSRFTYIKTRGCHIDSKSTSGYGMPSEAIKHICEIHDRGITFWADHNSIGDYTTDNSPIVNTP